MFVSKKVYRLSVRGKITINAPIKTGMIKIGYGNVGLFDKQKSRSIWEVVGDVIFNGTANLGHGSKISVAKTGVLEFGDHFSINAQSSIHCAKSIVFGKNCLLSWDVLVIDTDFHKIFNEDNLIINNPKSIVIGNKVWINCRCLILKGITIANNTVIGAGTIVSNDLNETNSIYAGSPVRKLKSNINWEI